MKFKVDGKSYQFDGDKLTFDEAELLEDHTGMRLDEFLPALQSTRVKAIRFMVFIAKRRAGEQVEWADLGDLDLVELSMSLVKENGLDLAAAANGQDPAAVTAVMDRLAARKKKPHSKTVDN